MVIYSKDQYDGKDTNFGYANKHTRDMRYLMERMDINKHPSKTHQGFDFFMNLGAY